MAGVDGGRVGEVLVDWAEAVRNMVEWVNRLGWEDRLELEAALTLEIMQS